MGLDFGDKVIDPAFNDFVKEVVPAYSTGEILPKKGGDSEESDDQIGG